MRECDKGMVKIARNASSPGEMNLGLITVGEANSAQARWSDTWGHDE